MSKIKSYYHSSVRSRKASRLVYCPTGRIGLSLEREGEVLVHARCVHCMTVGEWGKELLDYRAAGHRYLILVCDKCAESHGHTSPAAGR